MKQDFFKRLTICRTLCYNFIVFIAAAHAMREQKKGEHIMSGYTVKNKGVAFIFNVIITAICLASVLAYFVLPLWKVNVSCTLTSEMFRSITGESGENEELMKEIADELEKKPIDAAFDITLKTKTFLASFASDGEKLVAEMVDYNAETLANQLSGTVKEVSKAAVRATAKNSLKETLKDGSAEYQWKDEETVNAELDKLTDALMKDDATVSSVSDAAADAIANVYKSETGNDIPEADKQAAKAEMEKMLKEVADENGNIDADKLITDMLAQMLSGNSGSGNNENGDGNGTGADKETAAATFTAAKTFHRFLGIGEGSGETAGSGGSSGETTGSGEADSMQALKDSLTQAINEKIGGQMNTFLLVMKITGGVILFTLFTWAYIVLKILCKAATANPVVKLKLPIWLGWLPFLILYAVPTGVIKLAGSASAETAAMLAGMNFSFFTCGVVSALAALALIIAWVPYHRLIQRD